MSIFSFCLETIRIQRYRAKERAEEAQVRIQLGARLWSEFRAGARDQALWLDRDRASGASSANLDGGRVQGWYRLKEDEAVISVNGDVVQRLELKVA